MSKINLFLLVTFVTISTLKISAHPAQSWSQSHPSWYSIGYLHTSIALSAFAGYAYAKLCAPHLLEKQWSDSWHGILDFTQDLKQPNNGLQVAASVAAVLVASSLIHTSNWGKAFDELDDTNKKTGLLSVLATSSVGCLFNRYLT